MFVTGPSEGALAGLVLNGKKVRDPTQVLAQVERRVEGGHVELGTCSLCSEEMSRNKLVRACGRSGCKQKVDEGCLREWASLRMISSDHSPTHITNKYICAVRQMRAWEPSEPDAAYLSLLSTQANH